MSAFQFRPPYSISGQTGKALTASRRSLEQLGIETATLQFRSADADTLEWFQRGDDAPEYGQEISLWDADGNRVFTGNCTTSDPEWDGRGVVGYQVTVSGPWWWLEQAQLTGLVTDSTGATSERPSFLFPAQDLAISIRTLLDRMQGIGVPLQCGDIDPTFPFCQMIMQGTSAATALRDMLAVIPDSMTRVRYDVDGLPALDVLRRRTAPLKTIEIGTDHDLTGVPRLRSRRSLRPTSVTVQSASVNALGQVIYSQQTAGDSSGISGVLGRQLIAVSGPGRADFRSFQPRIATLQTEAIPPSSLSLWLVAQAFDPVIQSAEAEHGAVPWTSFADYGNFPTLPRGITGAGSHRVIAGEVIDFLKTEFGITEESTRVSGWIIGTYPSGGYGDAAAALIAQGRARGGFFSGVYTLAVFVDFTVQTINQSHPTLQVFVHPADQALVTPVANLADNLFETQDWLPYDGEVPLHPGSEIQLPGTTLNIRGALPEWATMRGLVTGSQIDLRTGAARLQIGAASRLSASALIDRFSRPTSGRVINL